MRIAQMIRTGTGYLVAGFLGILFGLPVLLARLISSSNLPGYFLARVWCWGVSKAVGLSASLMGMEKVIRGKSYIIVSNHQSHADILALARVLPLRCLWTVKKELLKVPFFGWGLRAIGAISLDRANFLQSVEALKKAAAALNRGWSLLVYPEGTRSPDGNLLPFKKGAFVIAVATGLPILPVTVNGSSKILPKGLYVWRPGHVTVTVGEPIPTEGLSKKDIPSLVEMTRQSIERHLDLQYDPFRD